MDDNPWPPGSMAYAWHEFAAARRQLRRAVLTATVRLGPVRVPLLLWTWLLAAAIVALLSWAGVLHG
jgi:hypothetical protein